MKTWIKGFAVATSLISLLSVGSTAVAKPVATDEQKKECESKLAELNKGPKADLTLSITGQRNHKGHILISIFGEACGGFPDVTELAVAKLRLTHEQAAHFVVELPPGRYAFAILHDANDDEEMNTFAGMPKEGYAFSVDQMMPPSFEKAAFTVPVAGLKKEVKIRYLL